jgi:hypothetical protein
VFVQILLLMAAAARGLRAAAVAFVRVKLAIARKLRKLEESIFGICFVSFRGGSFVLSCLVSLRILS